MSIARINVAAAATAGFCLIATLPAFAETKRLYVPAGICPQLVDVMVSWSRDRDANTVYALPTAPRGSNRSCGESGPAVTAGIATAASETAARRAALDLCNENRGDNGRCVVTGTLRSQ